MLFKVRHFLAKDILLCLYVSLFSTFLHYGIVVLGLTYENDISLLFLLQKRVVKVTSRSYFQPFFELVDSVHQYSTLLAKKNNIFYTQRSTLHYDRRSVRYH